MIAARLKKADQAQSPHGMVSTASRPATEAGVKMLEKGGNAVDAAVAAAFCLGVSEPQSSGIGGQSMALLYLAGNRRVIALDGSSRAPFGISCLNLPGKPIKTGLQSTTLPSTPAVLGYLLDRYGKLSLQEVLEPAIRAALHGFHLTPLQRRLLSQEAGEMQKDPLVATTFYQHQEPWPSGEPLRQKTLALCLKRMAHEGWQDFYQGEIAQKIVDDMKSRGGLIGRADLNHMPVPVERAVLETGYRQYRIHTFPPPGSGRVLIQILNTLEDFTREELRPGTPTTAVILALAIRFALQSGGQWPADPARYPQLKKSHMLDKHYAKEIARRIRLMGAWQRFPTFTPLESSGETTHLSVADNEGNAVGITQSVELPFGCKRMTRGLGFFYNNYLSTFNYTDMTHPYYLLPGASPWSSVAPTFIFEGFRPRFLLGSPGSMRIGPVVAQVVTGLIDGGQSLAAAVGNPRLYCTPKGKLFIEADRFHPEVLDALVRAGLQVNRRAAFSFYLGCVQAVQFPRDGTEPYLGVADPRRYGVAKGPNC